MTVLFNYYGWRGSFVIIAGFQLNMCVLGALMRPFKDEITETKTQSSVNEHKGYPEVVVDRNTVCSEMKQIGAVQNGLCSEAAKRIYEGEQSRDLKYGTQCNEKCNVAKQSSLCDNQDSGKWQTDKKTVSANQIKNQTLPVEEHNSVFDGVDNAKSNTLTEVKSLCDLSNCSSHDVTDKKVCAVDNDPKTFGTIEGRNICSLTQDTKKQQLATAQNIAGANEDRDNLKAVTEKCVDNGLCIDKTEALKTTQSSLTHGTNRDTHNTCCSDVLSSAKVLQNKFFMLYCFLHFLATTGYSYTVSYLPTLADNIGETDTNAALLVSVFGT